MKRIYFIVIIMGAILPLHAGISFRGNSSFIHVASGQLTLNQMLSQVNGTIIRDADGSIIGQPIEFSAGVLQEEGNDLLLSAVFDPAGEINLNGNGLINGNGGSVLQQVFVNGINNRIGGSFNLQSDIVLQDSLTTLSIAIQSSLNKNIRLNGGRLFLEDDLNLIDRTSVTGFGSVHSTSYGLYFNGRDILMTSTIAWHVDGTIDLNGSVDLRGTWTFAGETVVNVQNNTINLSNGGSILVDENAHLTIKNARLMGVHDANFSCLADNSLITFDNVLLVLDDDYTFSIGSIHFKDLVELVGESYIFAYQTEQTSTILSQSIFRIGQGVTFSYDPTFTAAQNLIVFEDATAQLELDGAILQITHTGMQCTVGQITIVKDSDIYTESENGFIIGDGDPDHDALLRIIAGASLRTQQGVLEYRNVMMSSLLLANNTSKISMLDNTRLNLYEDIDLGPGILEFYNNTILARVPGVQIDGSVHVFGALQYVTI